MEMIWLLPGYFLSKIVTFTNGTSQSWGLKNLSNPTSLQQAKWRWPHPQVGSDLFWIDPYPVIARCDRKIASECVCDKVWCVAASTMCVYEKERKECGKGEENLLSQTWTACVAANFLKYVLKSTSCHSVGFQETSQSHRMSWITGQLKDILVTNNLTSFNSLALQVFIYTIGNFTITYSIPVIRHGQSRMLPWTWTCFLNINGWFRCIFFPLK